MSAALTLVRRVGYRGASALGAGLGVTQFRPLLLAGEPARLLAPSAAS